MTISIHKCGYCGQDYGAIDGKRYLCRCQKGEWIALVVAAVLVMCLIGAGLSHVFSLVVPEVRASNLQGECQNER